MLCVLPSPRPSYYRNANRITMLAHGVLQSCEQICRLPSGTRLPSILLERGQECRLRVARRALSRWRDSHDAAPPPSPKIPIILGSIKTSRRRATKELAVVRCAKYHAISLASRSTILFRPSRVLRRILLLDEGTE